VKIHTISPWHPDKPFQHGVAICWHDGKLHAFYAVNRIEENGPEEECHFVTSNDGGETWCPPLPLVRQPISHGVFLSHDGNLWAFNGIFNVTMKNGVDCIITKNGRVCGRINNFWPCQEPQRMSNGSWIMAGLHVTGAEINPPVVAISRGLDFTTWDRVEIPCNLPGPMWGECSVVVDNNMVILGSRYGREERILLSGSGNFGRNWEELFPGQKMSSSKFYAGNLSDGRSYLIGNFEPNSRKALSISVYGSKPKVLIDGSSGKSYPYAVEYEGSLYVAYSDNEGRTANPEDKRTWNNNAIKLMVIPLEEL